MNKTEINKLKKKSFITGCPCEVTFKNKEGKKVKIPATRGERVVKWKDILKLKREMLK